MSEELDRYIHERLFRKCWHEYKSAPNGEVPFGREHCIKCGEIASLKPHYSTNISDAMKAVDEMKRRGFGYVLAGFTNEKHRACFMNNFIDYEINAETLEMAICLAVKEYLDSEGK